MGYNSAKFSLESDAIYRRESYPAVTLMTKSSSTQGGATCVSDVYGHTENNSATAADRSSIEISRGAGGGVERQTSFERILNVVLDMTHRKLKRSQNLHNGKPQQCVVQ